MSTAMQYRRVRKALLANGCTWRAGKGDHLVWYCPCGEHMAVITTGGMISPGVVGDVIKKLGCLPKGWLQ
jgi:hypothetical protein